MGETRCSEATWADTGAITCSAVTSMPLPGFSAAEENSFVSRAQQAAFVHLLIHLFLSQQRVTEPGDELLNTTDPVLAAMKQETHRVYIVLWIRVWRLPAGWPWDKLFPCLLACFLTYKLGLEQNLAYRRIESIK